MVMIVHGPASCLFGSVLGTSCCRWSRVLQDAQQSQNSAMLEENMLRRSADTTIERYLHVLEAFLECAADLDLSLAEMCAGPFVDVLLNMGSDPPTRIHKTNALKALRWACKVWDTVLSLKPWKPVLKLNAETRLRCQLLF